MCRKRAWCGHTCRKIIQERNTSRIYAKVWLELSVLLHAAHGTLGEGIALLQEAGLEPQEVFDSKIAETEHDQAFIAQLAALLAPGVDPEELHAYQWKVVAKKR